MSLVISIYSKEAFREFNLPVLNNADYSITLLKDAFDLENDLSIDLEVMDDIWSVRKSDEYMLFDNGRRCEGEPLIKENALQIVTRDRKNLSMIISAAENPFHPLQKFRLHKVERITIGKDPASDISYDLMGMVSRNHAEIYRTGNDLYIKNLSPNGIYINSIRVDGEKLLEFGDYINIVGLHMVCLGALLAVDADREGVVINRTKLKQFIPSDYKAEFDSEAGRPVSSGRKIFRRAPRYVESVRTEKVDIDPPPQLPQEKEQSLFMSIGPSLTMTIPMMLGCMLMIYSYSAMGTSMGGGRSLFMYSGLVMAVSSAIIGVIWTLINRRNSRKESAASKAERQRKYGAYLDAKAEEIRKEYDEAAASLSENYPEVNVCLGYSDTAGRLWGRNAGHGDFLMHRIGTGNVPFDMKIGVPASRFSMIDDELASKPAEIRDEFSTLYNVPVTVDLFKHNLIGIIGDEGKRSALDTARVLSAQIAANNCYTDVKLAYIYDDSCSSDHGEWDFARWLPHVWSEDRKTRFIASDREKAQDILYELGNVFRARLDAIASQNKAVAVPKPYYILFISDYSMVEDAMFSKVILDADETYGLTTVILAESNADLPNKCEFIIENTARFSGYYETLGTKGDEQEASFDHVSKEGLEQFARRLSGIQVLEIEEGGEIPDSLTFFDMMGINRPEDIPVRELWAKNRTYENIRGLIGQKAGGVPCYLDVHEKFHGPHGLVAGTTGSGKSETLQTYLLSLAVNYSPDDVAFFIIDYKGGGMANLFNGLPHLAGQISNLSGNQVKRAMISIKSENRRRQRIFTENGVNNINAYTKLYKAGEAAEPVPHLFIIIDEFAELKREEPDFMRELISVAQVGRSLGVHLILATQKPSGTVDDNIWSNSRFRLCLRVQDKQDSNDMLHTPDAAFLTQAGRCYLQVGNNELYELFQSGYSGAVYDENALDTEDHARMIMLNGKTEMSGRSVRQARARGAKKSQLKERTQLDAVRDYLARTGEMTGFTGGHRLWLPVLGNRILLSEFTDYQKKSFDELGYWEPVDREWNLRIAVGEMDDPENQKQMPFVLDLAEGGNVAVCGSIVSGKSTSLQTIAYALTQRYSPEVINIYALDFSSKMMSAFEKAPHFGGVMYDTDQEKIDKFFNMISGILEERKGILHGGNYKQYVRVHGVTMPAIVIMIDNYGAFKQKTAEAHEEILIRLSKEGISHGIYLIVSGGGYGMNEITSRVGENIGTVLTLALKDRYEYSDLLHAMRIDVLPESGVKGRGLAYCGERILEYQTAIAVDADNDYERMEKIRETCIRMNEAWTGRRARRIPEIPAKPVWEDLSSLEEFEKMCADRYRLPIGYNQANASVYGIDLSNTYCYGIYGSRATGKTNLMKVCVLSALAKGADVCVIDSPDKSLAAFDGVRGVTYCADDAATFEYFKALIPEFKKRNTVKVRLLSEGKEKEEIFEEISRDFVPVFIFVAELDQFANMIYRSQYDMKGFLENILAKGQYHNIFFFGDLTIENRANASGYAVFDLFLSYHTGIHLGGKTSANILLNFDYMPYSEQNKAEKVGIGALPDAFDENAPRRVVIPLVKKIDKAEN